MARKLGAPPGLLVSRPPPSLTWCLDWVLTPGSANWLPGSRVDHQEDRLAASPFRLSLASSAPSRNLWDAACAAWRACSATLHSTSTANACSSVPVPLVVCRGNWAGSSRAWGCLGWSSCWPPSTQLKGSGASSWVEGSPVTRSRVHLGDERNVNSSS